jgi:hypothetical protein
LTIFTCIYDVSKCLVYNGHDEMQGNKGSTSMSG